MTVIANWPVTRIDHWVALLRARAIENQAYVAGVNRCGTDPKLTYNGHSMIVHPSGRVMAAEASDRECLIHADISDQEVAAYRAELPFLKDILSSYAALGT